MHSITFETKTQYIIKLLSYLLLFLVIVSNTSNVFKYGFMIGYFTVYFLMHWFTPYSFSKNSFTFQLKINQFWSKPFIISSIKEIKIEQKELVLIYAYDPEKRISLENVTTDSIQKLEIELQKIIKSS